jgi:hypothetical protein
MKFFRRKIEIPKDNAQTVEVVQSFTVSWRIKTGWSGDFETYHKVFVSKIEANEFKKQLEESAKFIKCWINTKLIEN